MISLETVSSVVLVFAVPLFTALIVAAVIDQRSRRIPNILVALLLALGVFMHSTVFGLSGLAFSLTGAALGLALMLPLHLTKGIGAGDVKLMTAVGSFIGAATCFWAVLYTLAFGGIIAALILFKQSAQQLVRKANTVGDSAENNAIDNSAILSIKNRERFPYAIAILSGTAMACITNRESIFLQATKLL